jgi:hypothetical protein
MSMPHEYKAKISGRYVVWLWKPANRVKKFPYWSYVGARKKKAEAQALADTALRDATQPGESQ